MKIYNIGRYANTDKQFEAHKTYGIKEENGVINVYIYSLFEGYSFVGGKFKAQSGGSYPVYMVLKRDKDKYTVVQYNEPQDGTGYANSIRSMFPSEYAEKAIKDTGFTPELQEQIKVKAKRWLKEMGKSIEVLE